MEEFDENEIECSYCGASLYVDAAQCGKCGNFTDGLGPRNRAERPGEDKRPLARKFIIAGWLVLIAFLLPILLAVIGWFSR